MPKSQMQQVLASLQSKHATLLSKFRIAGILASSNFGKVDTCNEQRSLRFMAILLGFKEKINRNWKRWVKSLIIWELGATK
jgi:hypothetical protein